MQFGKTLIKKKEGHVQVELQLREGDRLFSEGLVRGSYGTAEKSKMIDDSIWRRREELDKAQA